MAYSEAADIAAHKADLSTMDWRLNQANADLNWAESLVLDVGGAGGLHAALLAPRCRRIYFTDLTDCNLRYQGEFIRLLAEKCERNGLCLPMARLEFHAGNAMELIYRDGLFDFVCSFNAFEHISEPPRALAEMARVTRPGGWIYLTFDPIWTADSGSHFAHFHEREPWAHLVDDPERFEQRIRDAGATDQDIHEARVGMNRVRLAAYEQLLQVETSDLGLQLRHYQTWSGYQFTDAEAHPNYTAALQKGYSSAELSTRGIAAVFQKRLGAGH